MRRAGARRAGSGWRALAQRAGGFQRGGASREEVEEGDPRRGGMLEVAFPEVARVLGRVEELAEPRIEYWRSDLGNRAARLYERGLDLRASSGVQERLHAFLRNPLGELSNLHDLWEALSHRERMDLLLRAVETAGVAEIINVVALPEMAEVAMELVKENTRPLTAAEIGIASVVYGDSIRYDLVRVDEDSLTARLFNTTAYVSFHTINAGREMGPDLLIHELVHVWQYERMGSIYIARALHAQETAGYDYGGPQVLREAKERGGSLGSFNLEQQGEIVRDYYRLVREGATVTNRGGHAMDCDRDVGVYAHFVAAASTHSVEHLADPRDCGGRECLPSGEDPDAP